MCHVPLNSWTLQNFCCQIPVSLGAKVSNPSVTSWGRSFSPEQLAFCFLAHFHLFQLLVFFSLFIHSQHPLRAWTNSCTLGSFPRSPPFPSAPPQLRFCHSPIRISSHALSGTLRSWSLALLCFMFCLSFFSFRTKCRKEGAEMAWPACEALPLSLEQK